MSFIPEVKGIGHGGDDGWHRSPVRFATAGEAINYAAQWELQPAYRRAVESDDPVTHRWTLKGLVAKEKTP